MGIIVTDTQEDQMARYYTLVVAADTLIDSLADVKAESFEDEDIE